MDARALVRAVGRAGATRGLRAVPGWWRRRRADRALLARTRGVLRARAPGAVERVEPEPGGGVVRFARSVLRVRVAVGGAVFLGWDGAEVQPSYAVADGGCPPVDSRAVLEPDTAGGWRVVSERVLVVVARHGTVEIRTPGGLLLRRDEPPRWWETADGAGDGHWTQRSQVAADADVFGLGGRAEAARLREGDYRLWHVDGEVSHVEGEPTVVGLPVRLVVADVGSHLVFHDNSWDGQWTLRPGSAGEGSGHDRLGRCLLRMTGGPVRYWVLPGPPARALRGWAALTGAAAVPPGWALGYQHAVRRWEVGELAELVEALRARGTPPRGLRLGARTVQSQEAAELTRLSKESLRAEVGLLRGLGPRVAVRPGEEWYECGRAAKLFVAEGRTASEPVVDSSPEGDGVFPDFTDPRARKWWAREYQLLLEQGASGFWHQPYELGPLRGSALPLSARHALEGRGGDHREAHNVLPLTMARAAGEALAEARGVGASAWLLSSGAWVGSQRYGGVCVRAPEGWAGLRASVAVVMGLGLCGVPQVGVEVREGLTSELGLRWFQLAGWLPMFVTAAERAELPTPPSDGELARCVAAVVAQRERLLPYWSTLAEVAAATGAPVVRPLWWHTPSDRALRAGDADAFLVGDVFLVAPVCEPGVRRREVRLPRGSWYDTASGEVFHGPGVVTVAAPLTRVPVLARAGTVVPVADAGGVVTLEVWAPRTGQVGGGLYARPAGADAEAGLTRYAVVLRDGEPVVTREDGGRVECPVRVRARGA